MMDSKRRESTLFSRPILPALGMLLALAVLVPARAHAQEQKVLELTRQAMDDYNNLDMDRARAKLERALEAAAKGKVSGSLLAQVHINLGVVYIAGLGDNGRGMDQFSAALDADPASALDPLTSTPEIQTVWNLAKKKAGVDVAPAFEGNIPHIPVSGQLDRTAVPVFVEVPSDAPVARATVFYRGPGATEYTKARMERLDAGFGFEIPCAVVQAPAVEYFLVAYDRRGKALGYAGKAEKPIVVPVVGTLPGAPPSLPGREAPMKCADSECPPGMPGCVSSPAMGEEELPEHAPNTGHPEGSYCQADAECDEGLVCDEELCSVEPPTPTDYPRFFVHLGGTLGAAYVTDGMPADGAPVGDGASTTHVASGEPGCDLSSKSDYCVRIQTPGLVPTFALRLTAGYYFLDRLGAAVTWRFQPDAGRGTLSSMLFGVRLQYLLSSPAVDGLSLAGFVGTSIGQIQPQPDQPTSSNAPYVRTGLNGVQLGAVLVYRFSKHVGLQFTPELHALLPLFLFNIDLTAGVEVAF